MRFSLLVLLGAVLVAGCRSSKEPRTARGKETGSVAKAQVKEQPRSQSRAINAVRGRVISVREDLRFAIVDFTGGKLPALDQRLNVYRLDQRVAEIRVSGPFRGANVAADIVAGDALPGDLVRDR